MPLFDTAREGFLTGEIRWDAVAVVKVVPVRAYEFDAAHRFVDDVTDAGGVLHGTPVALTSQTATAGVADAANVVFVALPPEPQWHHLLLFQASEATGGSDLPATAQRLIAILDDAPLIPNGGDVTLAWDNGPNKIFRL